ncbi:MAG: hypothetical protein BWY84_00236 [Candidatus Aerophobetes bacterium ADurb.Bin490]|nr:MAG: hypothetical protein BWY84_00236 [Candidatus Aerophobetes bacterium ADurb.Bin490]
MDSALCPFLNISVPVFSPCAERTRTFFKLPFAIIRGIPAWLRLRAVSSLETIPPVPDAVLPSVSTSLITASISSMTSIFLAPEYLPGFLSYTPSTEVSMATRSAFTRLPTIPASASLSPNFISSVATVSFSFITGITPHSISFNRVFLAFMFLPLSLTSSWFNRTCATVMPLSLNISLYLFISTGWPMAAIACFSCRVNCLFSIFIRTRPEPMAPEETIIISLPDLCSSVTCLTKSLRKFSFNPFASAIRFVPILTTILLYIFSPFYRGSILLFVVVNKVPVGNYKNIAVCHAF